MEIHQPADGLDPSEYVSSINTLTGAVILAAGSNITLTPAGNTITIASTSTDVTLTTIGSTPNANGATIIGQVLNLEPASTSFGGIITTGTQSIAGLKTFTSNFTVGTTPDAAFIANNTSGKASMLVAGALKSSFVFDSSGSFTIQAQTKANILNGTPSGTGLVIVDTSGNMGINTPAANTYSFTFGNGGARTFGIENTASGTVGRKLTVLAGSTVAGGTNVAGGDLQIEAGKGTGTGASNILFKVGLKGASGTTLQTLTTALTLDNLLQATFAGLVFPVQAPTASAPTYVKGAIYFDTTLNKLMVGGATTWETVTSL